MADIEEIMSAEFLLRADIENNEPERTLTDILNAIFGDGTTGNVLDIIEGHLLRFPRLGINAMFKHLQNFLADSMYEDGSSDASRLGVDAAKQIMVKFGNVPGEVVGLNVDALNVILFDNNDKKIQALEENKLEETVVYKKYYALEKINQGNCQDAANSILDSAIVRNINPIYLPIKSFIKRFKRELEQRELGTLQSLCVCHLNYKLYPSVESYQIVEDEFDCFLTKQEILLPSQIDLSIERTEIVEYFLREVCDLNILDTWYLLESSELLFDERIRCLKRLVDLSPSSAKDIQNQIIEFSAQIRTKDVLNSINTSKLRIDQRILLNVLSSRLELDYLRMMAMLDPEEIVRLENEMADFMIKRKMSDDFSRIKQDDTTSLLLYLLNSISDEYLNNGQIGLNQALGTRIRHNIFLDEISSSLKTYNVYLKKGDVNRGAILHAWSKIPNIRDVDISEELVGFTLDINKIIDDFKTKYIRVRDEKFKDGVFFIDVNQPMAAQIISLLNKETPFEDFLNIVIQIMNNQEMSQRVIRMRQLIDTELTPSIQRRLSKLHSRIDPSKTHEDISTLFRGIDTSLTRSFSEVKRWFSLESSISQTQTYTPDDSISTAVEVLKK